GLSLRLALLDEFGQRSGCQRGESAALSYLLIACSGQLKETRYLPVVMPNLRHAERDVNLKLAQRFAGRINLDDDIRRRVNLQINRPPPDDARSVLHIKACVRLRAF